MTGAAGSKIFMMTYSAGGIRRLMPLMIKGDAVHPQILGPAGRLVLNAVFYQNNIRLISLDSRYIINRLDVFLRICIMTAPAVFFAFVVFR